MSSKYLWAICAVAMLGATACNRASDQATVANDVAKANDEAAKHDAKAEESQAKTDVAKAQEKADDKKADSAYDTAVTEAEGAHKVAVEKCNALAGDAQKACKDKADARLQLAKANAK